PASRLICNHGALSPCVRKISNRASAERGTTASDSTDARLRRTEIAATENLLRWKILSAYSAGRSLRRRRSRRRVAPFARTKGNLFVTPGRHGQRLND